MVAAPFPPDRPQPMRSHDIGVKLMHRPNNVLSFINYRLGDRGVELTEARDSRTCCEDALLLGWEA